MQLAGVLHDIGKIGVADAIVNKPGPLTPAEWDEMQKHPEFGARMLERAELWDIAEWVLAHHERPDGKGYPLGLHGEQIPLEARIVAVADAYEAMTTDRVYRPSIGHTAARAELRRGVGHAVRRACRGRVPEGPRARAGRQLADRQRSRRGCVTVAGSTNASRPTTRLSPPTGTKITAWRPRGFARSAKRAGVSGSADCRSPRPSSTTSPGARHRHLEREARSDPHAAGRGLDAVRAARSARRASAPPRPPPAPAGRRVGAGASRASSSVLRRGRYRRHERRKPEHEGEQEQDAPDLHNLNLAYRFMDTRPIKPKARKYR